MTKEFEGRIALVTGASRGIGYQLTRELGARGAHVIAVARTVGGLEELDDDIKEAGGHPATLVPLDLADFDALDRLGGAIFERWKKLDIFVGNAGVPVTLSPLAHIKPKSFENLMAVTVTANWRLIRSLDPLLRQSDAGRALFLTAEQARTHTPFWGLHATSKAALEAMALTWANETGNTALKVNLADPGPVRSGLRSKAMPGEDPASLTQPEEAAKALMELVTPDQQKSGQRFVREGDKWAIS